MTCAYHSDGRYVDLGDARAWQPCEECGGFAVENAGPGEYRYRGRYIGLIYDTAADEGMSWTTHTVDGIQLFETVADAKAAVDAEVDR